MGADTDPARTPNHFLCLADRDPATYRRLVARAREIKRAERGEHTALRDDPRVVVLHTDDEDHLYRFASSSTRPVILGASACGDPVQALTDLVTAEEALGFPRVTVAFFGDGSRGLGRSLVEATQVIGIHLRIVAPVGAPAPIGRNIWVPPDQNAAVRDAQVIVGDPLPELPAASLATAAMRAIVLDGLAARTVNRACVEAALLEDVLGESPPARLLAWRATTMTARMSITRALERIADEHVARDRAKWPSSVARHPTIEVFAARRRDDVLTVSFVFHYRMDCDAQSGSDWGTHHLRTAEASFRGGEITAYVETNLVEHTLPESCLADYDDNEAARELRDAAIAELAKREAAN